MRMRNVARGNCPPARIRRDGAVLWLVLCAASACSGDPESGAGEPQGGGGTAATATDAAGATDIGAQPATGWETESVGGETDTATARPPLSTETQGTDTATAQDTADGQDTHPSTDGTPTGSSTEADTTAQDTGSDAPTDAEDTSVQDTGFALRRSAVLFTQVSFATPENQALFAADGILWGHMPNGYPDNTPFSDAAMAAWADKVAQFGQRGLDFFGRGEFDWGWKWQIDYMQDPNAHWAVDFDGNFIPFGGDVTYAGIRHYWQSHHGPEFVDWLKWQVDRLMMAPITHVMFDAQTSSTRTLHWNMGGDFNPHALTGFRRYLADRFSADELRAMGVDDVAAFDFLQYLKTHGYDRKRYQRCVGDLQGADATPLCAQFVYFHRQRLNEVMDAVFAHVDQVRPGIPIGSVNSPMEARGFLFSDRLDFLVGEYFIDLGSDLSVVAFDPITHYKGAEAWGKPLVLFPYPTPWKTLRDRNLPGLARTWIAQAYAHGAIFGIPGNIWVNPGTWQPGAQHYADLYRFIHDNKALFDGYRSFARVGLIVPMLANIAHPMDGSPVTKASTRALLNRGLSFDYVLFGDPGHPFAPDENALRRYDAIVQDGESWRLSQEQQRLLADAQVPLVQVDDADGLRQALAGSVQVTIDGADAAGRIHTATRWRPSAPDAPYVVHVLNRRWNVDADAPVVWRNVVLRIEGNYFPEAVTSATVYRLDGSSVAVPLHRGADGALEIPLGDMAHCWLIVALDH